MNNEQINIRNPLGKSVGYGIYDNILLKTVNDEPIIYSKLPEITEEDEGKILGVFNGIWDKIDANFNVNGSNSDWNQNDESQGDFIKNRPFYEKHETIILFDGFFQDSKDEDGTSWLGEMYIEDLNIYNNLIENKIYTVVWQNEVYNCRCKIFNNLFPYIGNDLFIGGEDTGEPFIIGRDNVGSFMGTPMWLAILGIPPTDMTIEGKYECKITINENEIKKIEPKFIPIPFFGEKKEKEKLLDEIPFVFSYDFQSNIIQWKPTETDINRLQSFIEFWNSEWETLELEIEYEENYQKFICEPRFANNIKYIGSLEPMYGLQGDFPFVFILSGDTVVFALFDQPIQIISNEFLETPITLQKIENESSESLIFSATFLQLLDFPEDTSGDYKLYLSETQSYNGSDKDQFDVRLVSINKENNHYIGIGNFKLLPELSETEVEDSGENYLIYTKTSDDHLEEESKIIIRVEKTENTENSNEIQRFLGIVKAPILICPISLTIDQLVVQPLDSKYIEDLPWARILNKPFGTFPIGTVIIPETTLNFEQITDGYYAILDKIILPKATYKLLFDNKTYNMTSPEDGTLYYNDENIIIGIIEDYQGQSIITTSEKGPHTFKLTLEEEIIQKIDEKYIPEIDNLPKVTAEDSGKFLRVDSNGKWVAELMIDAEEVGF